MSKQNPKTPPSQRKSINPYTVSGTIGPEGIIQSKEEVSEKLRKRGICTECGLVRTHVGFHFRLKPLTVPDEVYKGHCLKCHNINDIKKSLGEKLGGGGKALDTSKKHDRKFSINSFLSTKKQKNAGINSEDMQLVPPTILMSCQSVASDVSSLEDPSVVSSYGSESVRSGSSSSLVRKDNEALTPTYTKFKEPPLSDDVKISSESKEQDEGSEPTTDMAQSIFDRSIVSHTTTLSEILEDIPATDEKENSTTVLSTPPSSLSSMVGAKYESEPDNSLSHTTVGPDSQALQDLCDRFNRGDFQAGLGIMQRESGSISVILAGLERLRDEIPSEAHKLKPMKTSQSLPSSWMKIIGTCIMS
eukprot:14477496-Ditylum_brightwellii.AAC.1